MKAADAAADLQIVAVDAQPSDVVLWLPAMDAVMRSLSRMRWPAPGLAIALDEWRGNASSDRSAARGSDRGYREYRDAGRRVSSAGGIRRKMPQALEILGT